MSTIQKMIDRLCPEGIEFKKLSSVVKSISSGLNPRKNFKLNTDDADCFYVTVKEITSGKIVFNEKTDRINTKAVKIIQNRSKLEKGDILLSGIGTIGKVALVDIPVGNWNCSESVILIKPISTIILSPFLRYVLQSDDVQQFWKGEAVGSTLKGIRRSTLESLEIPVPPIEVQEEIVKVLDSFSKLGVVLNAELAARKKQFLWVQQQCFANKTFIFNRRLEDCCVLVKGATPIQKAISGEYPLVVTTATRRTSSTYQFTEPSVCIPLVSSRGHGVASLNSVYYQEGKFALGNILCGVTPKNYKELNAKYLYYFLNYKKDSLIVPLMKGGANVSLTVDTLKKVGVSYPSIEEQSHVVSMLEPFDAFFDEEKGLPAEIKARQQQYEYYRDQLLTFKRAN